MPSISNEHPGRKMEKMVKEILFCILLILHLSIIIISQSLPQAADAFTSSVASSGLNGANAMSSPVTRNEARLP